MIDRLVVLLHMYGFAFVIVLTTLFVLMNVSVFVVLRVVSDDTLFSITADAVERGDMFLFWHGMREVRHRGWSGS